MMYQLTAAVFDMDGTLLDSSAMWAEVSPAVVRQFGAEPRPSIYRDMLPLGMREFAPRLKADYGLEPPVEEIARAIEAKVERYYFEEAALKPGALAFLRALKAAGVGIALATATDRRLLEPALARTGALPLLDAVFTCGEVGAGKHEPTIFRRAAEALGAPKAETWVFEDALYAIETARADGFPVCAVADAQTGFQWDAIRAAATCALEDFRQWRQLPFANLAAVREAAP